MSNKKEFNFNMTPCRKGLPITTEKPKPKTPTDPISDKLSDLGDTLELMNKMERAKRRGCISITRKTVVDGLADKLLSLLNVVYKEYKPCSNLLDVYFEHESLDVVPDGCVCPCYIVNIEDINGIRFDIRDLSGETRFIVEWVER